MRTQENAQGASMRAPSSETSQGAARTSCRDESVRSFFPFWKLCAINKSTATNTHNKEQLPGTLAVVSELRSPVLRAILMLQIPGPPRLSLKNLAGGGFPSKRRDTSFAWALPGRNTETPKCTSSLEKEKKKKTQTNKRHDMKREFLAVNAG